MTPDELRELLATDDSVVIRLGLPERRELRSIVTALANSGGGTLVIGADEETRQPRGLAHPGVVLDHVRQWLEGLHPAPDVAAEWVELGPGQRLDVVTVAPAHAGIPLAAEGLVLESVGNRLVPMSRAHAAELMRAGGVAPDAADDLAELILEQTRVVAELRRGLAWKRQLPLQVAFLLGGAVVGYLLGLWNPLH